jgi:hypothetical protein
LSGVGDADVRGGFRALWVLTDFWCVPVTVWCWWAAAPCR